MLSRAAQFKTKVLHFESVPLLIDLQYTSVTLAHLVGTYPWALWV